MVGAAPIVAGAMGASSLELAFQATLYGYFPAVWSFMSARFALEVMERVFPDEAM